jgi:CO dehydrogenase/acetyl-CoA synthase delta subunit
MIPDADKRVIVECAKKYNASRVLLHRSSSDEGDAEDGIVVGVDGIHPPAFFQFEAELTRQLSVPVDIVDLSAKSSFARVIEENGVKLLG